MISFAATLLALKLAESTRGIEFEGWDGVLGTAVICWVGSWLFGLGLAGFIDPGHPTQFGYALALALGKELIAAIVAILIAWGFVPGAQIKNAFGLVAAAILVVLFTYGAQMLVAGTALGWL